MMAMLTAMWAGPDRRIEQRPHQGPDRRRDSHSSDHVPPIPPWQGMPSDGFGSWLRQWLAPQTLIALVAFAGMTSVAHYRLSEVEREVATIRADMAREVTAIRADMAAAYARRDVLSEQLSTINMRLTGIERALRVTGRDATDR